MEFEGMGFFGLCEVAQTMVIERMSLTKFVLLSMSSKKFLKSARFAAVSPERYDINICCDGVTFKVVVNEKRQFTWKLRFRDFILFENSVGDDFGVAVSNLAEEPFTPEEAEHAYWIDDDFQIVARDLEEDAQQQEEEEEEKGLVTEVMHMALDTTLEKVDSHLRSIFPNATSSSVTMGSHVRQLDAMFGRKKRVIETFTMTGMWHLPASNESLQSLNMKNLEVRGICNGAFPQDLNIDTFRCEKTGFRLREAIPFINCRLITLEQTKYTCQAVNKFIRDWQNSPHFDKFERLTVELDTQPVLDIVLAGCNADVWDSTKRSRWLSEKDEFGRLKAVWDCRKGRDVTRPADGALATYMMEALPNKFRITFFVWSDEQRAFRLVKRNARSLLEAKQTELESWTQKLNAKLMELKKAEWKLKALRKEERDGLLEEHALTKEMESITEQLPIFREFEQLTVVEKNVEQVDEPVDE